MLSDVRFKETRNYKFSTVLIVVGAFSLVFGIVGALSNLPAGRLENLSNPIFVVFYPIGIVVLIAGLSLISSDLAELRLAKKIGDQEHDQANHIKVLSDEIGELLRPRVLVTIEPAFEGAPIIFDVSISNVGGTTAYSVQITFNPDLPYPTDKTLNQLNVFRNIPFIAPRKEIRFTFDSSISYMNNANAPKLTKAHIIYADAYGKRYEESLDIDILQFKDILIAGKKDMSDLIDRIEKISRTLEYIQRDGIITKSKADVEEEKRQREEWMKKIREQKEEKKS
ncbi:MAG: hypothetical protein ACYCQJ_10530 [Nitrososphaerales archaeon]